MRKSYIIIFFFISFIYTQMKAQEILGNTGGFNIPTAEMQPAGTFRGGFNLIGNGMITPEKGINSNPNHADRRWAFNYNTANYFINFTAFNWLELTFRETLLKSNSYGKKSNYKYREQDRSITVKARILKEGAYYPAIALGINDPYSFTGHHPFASAWGVATKSIHSQKMRSTWSATVGFMKAFDDSQMYDGVIAGLRWTPDWCREASLMAEYDTQGINFGIQGRIWKHLGIYVFTREFDVLCGGIKYETTIKF